MAALPSAYCDHSIDSLATWDIWLPSPWPCTNKENVEFYNDTHKEMVYIGLSESLLVQKIDLDPLITDGTYTLN